MEQVRAQSDRRLALLYRTGRRRPGRIFNDRGIDREGVAGLLTPDEFLELLKLDEIKLFLVQVRSQFGRRGQDEEAINEKNRPRHIPQKRALPSRHLVSHPLPHAQSVK